MLRSQNGVQTLFRACVGLSVAAAMMLLSSTAEAKKAPKVVIAHLAEVEEVIDEVTGEVVETIYQYNVIEVSENALKGHGNHEDAVDGEELADGTVFVADDYSKGDKIEVFVETEVEEEPES